MAALVLLSALSCSNSSGNPVIPDGQIDLTVNRDTSSTQTHLWGFYNVHIDIEKETVEAVIDRSGMFTANVTTFLNSNPFAMSFNIKDIIVEAEYVDVDIDVGLTHPFPGVPQYHGYDVRGAFMGNGSATLDTGNGLVHSVPGPDQHMMGHPDTGNGIPDGYTRWFNRIEFNGGVPLVSYTPGALASPGFTGDATLCPYKYFADSLDANEDLWFWLIGNTDQNGVFSSGATNSRNYYLRFPNSTGTEYGYAVIASWIDDTTHPANTVEAVGCLVEDESNVYYVDSTDLGGSIKLDISIFDWFSEINGGVMDDYAITLESTVADPVALDMTPVDGSDIYSTYHVEITADQVSGTEGNEYWVIVEYPDYDYSNEFGVPNAAENETLSAYFRYDLAVSSTPTNQNPICDLQILTDSLEGWDVTGAYVEFNAMASFDPEGTALQFHWDFDNDWIYDEDPDDNYYGESDLPTANYTESGRANLRVVDQDGGYSECYVDVDPVLYTSKNIPLRNGETAFDIAADPVDGDLLVLYEDGEIWRMVIDDWYQEDTDALFADLDDAMQPPIGIEYMDIAGNEVIVTCGVSDGLGQNRMAYFNPDGTAMGCGIWIGSSSNLYDAFAFGTSAGAHSNYAGDSRGRDADYNNRHYMELEWFVPPSYCGGAHFASYWIPYGGVVDGPTVIYWPYLVASETTATGPDVWLLEDDSDYYASRWTIIGSNTYNTLAYDGAYFGTGSQTDNDNGWNQGLDICRDVDDNVFVLDNLSTDVGRIKMWSVDVNSTTSEGGFGDATSISSDPQRIEGSDLEVEWFGAYMFVLHGNPTDGWMISIFFDVEEP